MKTALSLFALITLVFGVGCQTISQTKSVNKGPVSQPIANKKGKSNPLAKLTGKKLPKGHPDSIVAIWKDATYTVSGQTPTRGFGGRLYFYDQNKSPVVVEGDLVVYGFDNRDGKIDEKPEKRFIFTKEELDAHMSVSSAGPSYSVWLPWDHISGEEMEVSLVAVFKESAQGGRICRSEQITALLPGKKPVIQQQANQLVELIREKEAQLHNKQAVGFEATKPEGTKKIKSHEIKIPEGSKQRLFGTVPTVSYKLPKPKVVQASALEPISNSTTVSQPSTDF